MSQDLYQVEYRWRDHWIIRRDGEVVRNQRGNPIEFDTRADAEEAVKVMESGRLWSRRI